MKYAWGMGERGREEEREGEGILYTEPVMLMDHLSEVRPRTHFFKVENDVQLTDLAEVETHFTHTSTT